MCAMKRFLYFRSSDLDLRPLDVKFAPLVSAVYGHVYTKLVVSTAFLSEVIGGTGRTRGQREGQTDGMQH